MDQDTRVLKKKTGTRKPILLRELRAIKAKVIFNAHSSHIDTFVVLVDEDFSIA